MKVARAFQLTMVMMIIMCSYLNPFLSRLTKLALRWFLDGWFSFPRSMFARYHMTDTRHLFEYVLERVSHRLCTSGRICKDHREKPEKK
ncbi:hypothetical protein QR685DRAFT_105422 [Neurospora intermedia]|uniref:Secreted protein n=1 Tax=Neurospora intermedia TaxID=5142 RepID=A0ABR3D4T0_NEUIN